MDALSPAAPPGPTFIRGLDAHIHALNPSSSSALQRGDMLEIQGPSGSGKTAMLNFLAVTAIMPEKMRLDVGAARAAGSEGEEDGGLPDPGAARILDVDLGGKDQHVVYIHSATMPSPLLAVGRALGAHITHCIDDALAAASGAPVLPPLAPTNGIPLKHAHHERIESTLSTALSNLTVLRIPTAPNPYAPLAALLSYIPVLARGLDEELALVLIDGIGDGYWPGRWRVEREREEVRLGAARRVGASGVRGADEVDMHDVMRGITHLRKDLGAVVVVSVPGLWKARAPGTGARPHDRGDGYTDHSFWDAHLPAPYPRPFAPANHDVSSAHWPLTHHITLSAPSGHPLVGGNAIGQFRAETSLLGALTGDGERREVARDEAEWCGLVRCVRGAGQGVKGQVGVFGFKVAMDGLRP